jgi:hypothetical protein
VTSRAIYIGADPREADAFTVARSSAVRRLSAAIPVHGLHLADMIGSGLYHRPTERRGAQLWDTISDAPMATEFAISRFLTPIIARAQWALFMDCDVLVRADLAELFDLADPSKAVMCVQHAHRPAPGLKMDGQLQTFYARKNWSSVCLFNTAHPANRRLTVEAVNTWPGRDLHAFRWLADDEIGALPVEWNWLAGHSDPQIDPKIVHHTDGSPCMPGYEAAPYADEWRAELKRAIG